MRSPYNTSQALAGGQLSASAMISVRATAFSPRLMISPRRRKVVSVSCTLEMLVSTVSGSVGTRRSWSVSSMAPRKMEPASATPARTR